MNSREKLERLRSTSGSIEKQLDWTRLENWISQVDDAAFELLSTYVGECSFFWPLLERELETLPRDAVILEIGAGIGLLSHMLTTRGARVLAYEPDSSGFSRMSEFAEVIRSCWKGSTTSVTRIHGAFPQDHKPDSEFDLVVAINVVEHVPDPIGLVTEATALLRRSGRGFFVCPNYAFPYEPHFNFPTLFNKRLTGLVFSRRIKSSTIGDPEQFWADLSWPTVTNLSDELRKKGVRFNLSNAVLYAYLDRLTSPSFLIRKGKLFRAFGRLHQPLRLVIRLLPNRVKPIICLVTFSKD
jgi:2-polyprenyl-3-methyl-5-hydroxy-6-metoxy-1,4-benzoquinol methylase